MNKIQYIAKTHTNKDMAKNDKKLVNSLHNVYYIEADAETVHEMLDNGLSIGRIGTDTDFLLIDIDNSTVNISQVMEKLDNDKYMVSFSASNNPLKYHIVVKLDKTISIAEYEDVLNIEFEKIRETCCGRCDIMELDTNAKSFYQCFFGCSVDNEQEIVYENSKRLYSWTKKSEQPNFYIEKEHAEYPSLNSADYCKKHNLLTIKEEKRFDIILPMMTKGRMKLIPQGNRFNWIRMTGTKLLMRIFYLNEKLGENWSKFDFIRTAEMIFRKNVFMTADFEPELKSVLLWLDNKWDILVTKSFEEKYEILGPYFDEKKRQYKSRKYNGTVMTNIISEHLFDENTVTFTDKSELQEICKKNLINYYKFMNYCKDLNLNVEFEVVENKINWLKDYDIIDNTLTIERHKVTGNIRKYCSVHGIKIIRVDSL